jgi:hypothetical protein
MLTNDSLGLTPEERALVDAGVDALDRQTKRPFEDWIHIGRALQMLKAKPGGDDNRRWKLIREEAGFGAIERAVVSRLLQIMGREEEVVAWHTALPTNKKLAWCSPAAVMRNCPIFSKPAPPTEPKPSRYDKLATEHAVVLEKLHRLEREQADSSPHRESDTGTEEPAAAAPTGRLVTAEDLETDRERHYAVAVAETATMTGNLDLARRAYVTLLPDDPEARCQEMTVLAEVLAEHLTKTDIKRLIIELDSVDGLRPEPTKPTKAKKPRNVANGRWNVAA